MIIIFFIASYFALEFINKRQLAYENHQYKLTHNNHKYDLQNPKKRWDLPNELEEISGLSFYKNGQLACIQDEDGILYIYSLKKNEIIREERFGEKGDYEGVEIIDEEVYILKSNGKVFNFELQNSGIDEVTNIKTDLSRKNNAEGLGFHQDFQELLMACKEDPGTKKYELGKSRSVYRIDLQDKNFKKKPRFVIDGKNYKKILEEKDLSKKKHIPFKPSGVAVHPKTGFTFIIGTVGKMMVILNKEGEIDDLIPLDPKLFVQPEGICFAPNGDLFISSEGRGKKGYILKF